MRYRRCFQCVGLVSILLLTAVLGGLTAPLPSYAATAPSIVSATMQVDNGTVVPILGSLKTCPSTQFNWCYSLLQTSATGTNGAGKTRKFSVTQYSSTNTPSLNIADFVNSNLVKPTGFIIDPLVDSSTLGTGWSYSEGHTVTLTFKIKFDSCGYYGQTTTCTSNKDSSGSHTFGHGGTGIYAAKSCVLPICSGTNTVQGSRSDLSAKGDLSPTILGWVLYDTYQNPVPTDYTNQPSIMPFYWAEKSTSTLGTTYTLSSVTTYASNDCRESSTASTCAPTWTYTHRYSFLGPDQLKVADSDILVDFLTDLCFKPQGPPTNNPNNPCKNQSGKKLTDISDVITNTLSTTSTTEVQDAQNAGYPLGEQCALDDPACPCTGPQCVASYVHILQVTPNNNLFEAFPFKASGPGLGTVDNPLLYSITPIKQTIVFPDGTTASGWFGVPDAATTTLLNNIPAFGGQWRFDVNGYPPGPDTQHVWDMDAINCTSKLYGRLPSDGGTVTSDSFTFWDEPQGSNGVKTGMDVFALQGKDVLWCVWHIHPTSIN